MHRKHVLALSLAAAALASVAVYAQKGGPSKHEVIEVSSCPPNGAPVVGSISDGSDSTGFSMVRVGL